MRLSARGWRAGAGMAKTNRMASIFSPPEVYHAVETGECRAATLVPMGIEFLLRQDIAATL